MDDAEALSTIVNVLRQLERDAQARILDSVYRFLGFDSGQAGTTNGPGPQSVNPSSANFSTDRTMSAKEFLRDKKPLTDVERITCLAYYLTHYRSTPFFKTVDISTVNTEAAQPKFANASDSVENATRLGYLVAATKGNKQLSAVGEHYVELLPDREAAREVARTRPNRKSRKSSKAKTAQ